MSLQHPRTIVRDAVCQKLRELFPELPVDTRLNPYEDVELPGINVRILSDRKTRDIALTPEIIERELSVEVVVIASSQNQSQMQADLDQLCLIIESHINEQVAPIVRLMQLNETEILYNDKGDEFIGSAQMTFTTSLIWETPSPEADGLPTLDRVWMNWDLAPTDGQIDAVDRVEYRQESP